MEERRKSRRIKIKKLVKINDEPCIMLDISSGGLRVSTDKVPGLPYVKIRFVINNKVIELDGIIRWRSKENPFTKLIDLGIAIEKTSYEFDTYIKYLYKKNN